MKAPSTAHVGEIRSRVAHEPTAREGGLSARGEVPVNLGRLLTTQQAADVLAVSVGTVKNLMGNGKLAYVKIGRATRLDLGDIDQYIVRHRRKQRQGLRSVTWSGEPGAAARP